MFNYNRKTIVIISLIFSIIICICTNLVVFYFHKILSQKNIETQTLVLKISKKVLISNEGNSNIYLSNNWRILIPKINVNAPIFEKVTNENMKKAVAHFENTPKWNGNVCLAAHNRGYKYNYFMEIHTLEKGDIIYYESEYGKKMYEVILNTKIKETDWSYLEDTKDNRITLITCVKDMPEYRICIQARELI